MPNWITTRIKFSDRVSEIREFINGETPFDFNKIVPMPEDLDIESSSDGDIGMKYILANAKNPRCRTDSDNKVIEKASSHKNFNKIVSLGRKYISNLTKYGYATWRDWRCSNWGTKWNAVDAIDIDGDRGCIEFLTAWSFCNPIMQRLSEIFDDVEFEYVFTSENPGEYAGRGCYVNGEDVARERPRYDSKDAYEIYFELYPEYRDQYEFNENTGTYECIDND